MARWSMVGYTPVHFYPAFSRIHITDIFFVAGMGLRMVRTYLHELCTEMRETNVHFYRQSISGCTATRRTGNRMVAKYSRPWRCKRDANFGGRAKRRTSESIMPRTQVLIYDRAADLCIKDIPPFIWGARQYSARRPTTPPCRRYVVAIAAIRSSLLYLG